MTNTPRRAAAVVLVRLSETGPEVFWVRRGSTTRFMAGFHAFPGGVVGKDETPEQAALRELEEEVGVVLSGTDALSPAGHWITPPFMPRRFDALYFLAHLPDGQEAAVPEGGELASGQWVSPADALATWQRGEALCAPPVLQTLRTLDERPADEWASALDGSGKIERIEFRPGVVLVPIKSMTIPPATHTNAYILGTGELLIVDPGAAPGEDLDQLFAPIEAALRGGARINGILITHHHIDHVAGANWLREKTGAPLWAHQDTAEMLDAAVSFDRILVDGETLALAGDTPVPEIKVLHTPGHAKGHLCFLDTRGGSLLTGDLILGYGTTIVAPPDGNMSHYMASLRSLLGLDIDTVFPGHGPVLGDALGVVEYYIQHREQREAKVVAALAAGHRTIAALVAAAYDDTPVAMHVFAEHSLRAILEKLADDGTARPSDEGWEPV